MKGKESIIAVVIIFLTTAAGLTFSYFYNSPNSSQINYHSNKPQSVGTIKSTSTTEESTNLLGTLVTKVIDGDTIEIESGQRVRYIGIDTPETVHPDIKTQCFGAESSSKNKELVEGKRVRLEKDISETDKYGRLLRYVYVGDVSVNDLLVREGYANSSSYPPDIKYQNQLNQAQQEAQQASRGLWGSCSPNATNNTETSKEGCDIKGNISSSGEKIYHISGQKYYNKTVVDQAKGEQWFCSEEQAQESGFRKSKT